MKTVQFETTKVYVIFVKLPDGAKAWKNESYHISTLWYKTDEMRFPKAIDLPNENYKVVGFITNLTDSQKEAVVERVTEDLANKNDIVYRHYMDDGSIKIDPVTKSKTQIIGFYECGNHLEALRNSFASLLESKGIEDLENWILLTANK